MSNNECILCSCEVNNESDFLEFPQNNSNCKCKYFIHNNCINEMKEGWGNKCPICFVEFNNTVVFQQPIEIIVDNNTQLITLNNEENRINKQKCCLKFLLVILLFICVGVVIFTIYS